MDNYSASSSSSEEEELLCNICDETVTLGSKNTSFEAHFEQHLQNPKNCGQVVYFSKKMPIQETPKTRGLMSNLPKRSHTFTGPLHSPSSKQAQFIHGASPSPRSKPLVHQPDMTRSIPKLITGHSEPTKKAVPMYNLPLKSQSFPRMYSPSLDDEKINLIDERIDNTKESWYHESEFHVMSKVSNSQCPKCGGLGPFVCGMKSTGNIFCLSSCLLPCLPFISCCLPQPSLTIRIFCTRCNHELMEFDPKERWLVAR